MIRFAFVAACFAAAAPAVAQDAGSGVGPAPAPDAAGKALAQCIAHASGMGQIAAPNASQLNATGFQFSETPPPFLEPMAQNKYGHAVFLQAPSAEGQVWAAGYDSGACIVVVLGTQPAPIETRLKEMFSIPNSFKPEPIKQLSGVKLSQWRWKLKPNELVALMNVRDLPPPAFGEVMVTITPKSPEKK